MSTTFGANVEHLVLLDLLGQAPVSFPRIYVEVAGSIYAALWLSYALSKRAGDAAPALGANNLMWFAVSREDCEESTGLTRHQQAAVRRDLRNLGLLRERRGKTNEVAIDTATLGQRIRAQSLTDWGSVFGKQAGPVILQGRALS